MPEKPHPGITMHSLSFGGGFMGLVFGLGSALIFLIGFPTLWCFLALAIALGLVIAVYLRSASHRISQRNKPLSLFAAASDSEHPVRRKQRIRWHRLSRLAAA